MNEGSTGGTSALDDLGAPSDLDPTHYPWVVRGDVVDRDRCESVGDDVAPLQRRRVDAATSGAPSGDAVAIRAIFFMAMYARSASVNELVA